MNLSQLGARRVPFFLRFVSSARDEMNGNLALRGWDVRHLSSMVLSFYSGVVTLIQSSTLLCSGGGSSLRTARGSYFFFCSSLSMARIRATVSS